MVVTYPYGTRTKERFRVRGQLFEGKEVCFLRFVQGLEDGSGIHPVSEQGLWKTKVLEAHQNGNCHRAGILPTATGLSTFARPRHRLQDDYARVSASPRSDISCGRT